MGFSKCYPLVLKFFLVLLTVSTLSIRSETARDLDQRRLLRDLLEEALVNNGTILFILQKLFFNPVVTDPESVLLSVQVTVVKILYPESCCDYEWDYYYKSAFSCQQSPLPNNLSDCNSWISNVPLLYEVSHNYGTTQTSNFWEEFSITTRIFSAFDPSYYALISIFSGRPSLTPERNLPSSEDYYFYNGCPNDYITFEIGELELMPSNEELANALSILLVWVSVIEVLFIAWAQVPLSGAWHERSPCNN